MDIKKLISKINIIYDLLDKIPLGLDFYEKYHEYKILAIEIDNLVKIDKKPNLTDKNDPIESFMFDTLYGYIYFKISPLLIAMERNKDIFFSEFPNEKLFQEVKYSFLKLGKMEDDERYEYWLSKTNDIFNKFLENIKTTKKGDTFLIETNIMNAIPEINDLYIHIKKDKDDKKSYIERMDENDTYGLVKKIQELEKNQKKEFTISIKNKGKTDYIGFYDRNTLTKKEMLEPVNMFQSLIISNLKDKKHSPEHENIVYFDSESSRLLCNKKEVKIIKGKDIYYMIKYIFKRSNIYDECFYDEIKNNSELDKEKNRTDKNISDALNQFNKRVIKKNIKDLFIITSHSIKIKNKYKIGTL